MGEPPPHHLGEGISAGQSQRTRGTTAEGGPALSDDTCKGVLQQDRGLEILGCWTTLMRRQEGRSNQSSLTFDL